MSAVASEAPASEATWRTFAIVAAAIIIGQGSLSLVSAALPLHLSGIGVPEARIGAEVGSANLVGLVCTLLVGPLINRAGPHRLLRAGMGCYLVAAIGLLLVHGEVLVVLCRALQGCGTALVMPSALTMAPRVVPLRPGAALGVIGSLNNVSLAIAPPLGLWLYDQGGGPRLFGPAVACAGGGLLAGLLLPALASTGQRARGFGFDRRWIPTLAANGLLLAYFGGRIRRSLAHPGALNAGPLLRRRRLRCDDLKAPSGALVDRYGARPRWRFRRGDHFGGARHAGAHLFQRHPDRRRYHHRGWGRGCSSRGCLSRLPSAVATTPRHGDGDVGRQPTRHPGGEHHLRAALRGGGLRCRAAFFVR
ncbi:MAG: MFS transporter [Chloroflexia bacterium]